MNITIALVRDTFREAFARKIFWGFLISCTAILLFLIFILRVDVVAGAMATVTIFGRSAPTMGVSNLVEQTQSVIAMILYFMGMALAVFASAGLVAAVFEPGRIELLLSKPVSRTHLLLGRYIGNVLVVAANIIYLVAGSWVIFGIKTHVWGAGYLYSSLFTIFIFAVLLAVLVLVGVLWDSSAVAIMATFAIMFLTPILAQKNTLEKLLNSEWSRELLRFLYYVLPKTSDVSVMIRHVILDQPIDSWMPVWSTALFGAVALFLGIWAIPAEEFLMRPLVLTLFFASALAAQPHIDNVLEKMVPLSATGLVGAHMDQIKQTDLYRKLLAGQGLGQLDQFARETGFDPRRDVREILFVTEGNGVVLLARGSFHINPALLKSATKTRHGNYDIWGQGTNGFCILDSSLAAAGDIPAVTDALNEWTSGAHTAAQRLLGYVSTVNPQFQIWGVSTGTGNFLADHPPAPNTGLDFTTIFRTLQDYWFQADFSSGMRAEVHANTHTEKDAMNIRDAVRGLVGLGRLNTPDNQPDLLKVWDGISVDQQGRSISLRAEMPQELVDRLVQMLSPRR